MNDKRIFKKSSGHMGDNVIHIKKVKRIFILISVMLAMFLSAIEATIVSTAMPTIVGDLGGFSLYSWVFSAYLLTNAATVLIFGKLADIFGRKPIFLIGILIFLTGSTLSGFSSSMYFLIVARFIQGLGAGALMPVSTTIIGDIYNKVERAKIQGYLSSVWGVSAILGPLLGGFFVDVLDWRYVFWMNIPLGILAMLGVFFFLDEQLEKKDHKIDYAGAVWLFIAIGTLLFILVEGGVGVPWASSLMKLLIGVTITAFVLFFNQQRRAEEPMLPLEVWGYPMIRIANLASLTTGMILIGVSSYLPAFVQGVMGQSAIIAGFTLTTMSIGWPLASLVAGRLLLRIGYRKTSLIGAVSLVIGALLFYFLSPEKGPIWAGTGSFFIGIGLGMTSTAFIVGIQSAVGWEVRGIATATNMFMRSLGSALGVALLGGILNNQIKKYIMREGLDESVSIDAVNILLDPDQQSSFPEDILSLLKEGLTSGLHVIYAGLLFVAIVSLILIYFMPKKEEQ